MREAGMMPTTGTQGVGKTYQNMYIIKDYTRDKFNTKVKARKCLIYDVNGEYTKNQFYKNGINIDVKTLKVSDVVAWSKSNLTDCRRIDAKSLGGKEKKELLAYLIQNFRNGLLVVEDINNYVTNITHIEEVIGGLVNLRHRAVDVLISYQSLRALEPRIFQNCRWLRMHYQNDNVDDIKSKVTNPELFKIAQLLINRRYHEDDKRFFVYIFVADNKLEGKFGKDEFYEACRNYLRINKKIIKEVQDVKNCSKEEAEKIQLERLYKKYYGNKSK